MSAATAAKLADPSTSKKSKLKKILRALKNGAPVRAMSSVNDPFEGFNRKKKEGTTSETSSERKPEESEKSRADESKQRSEKDDGDRSSGSDNDNKSRFSSFQLPSTPTLLIVTAVAGVIVLALLYPGNAGFGSSEIDWTTFQHKLLEKGEVEKLEVHGELVRVFLKGQTSSAFYFTIGSAELLERKLEAAQIDLGKQPWEYLPVHYMPFKWLPLVLGVIPGLILFGVVFSIFRQSMGRQSGIFSMGRSKSKYVFPTSRAFILMCLR